MIPDDELKSIYASQYPYRRVARRTAYRDARSDPSVSGGTQSRDAAPRMQAFGYTVETMQFMLNPLVRELRDPLGSMGNDSALAVMSDKLRMLYDYFKQLFAQVTNPAIDSIREEVIMALQCYIGPEQNLLQTEPAKNAHRLWVPHPVLTNEELFYRGHGPSRLDLARHRHHFRQIPVKQASKRHCNASTLKQAKLLQRGFADRGVERGVGNGSNCHARIAGRWVPCTMPW